jgi:DNA transposition AAA+ family ATPase
MTHRNAFGPIPENDRVTRAKALKLGERGRHQVVALLRDYLDRSGLSTTEFAARINYSRTSVALLLNDKYHQVSGNAGPICQAIIAFITAHPIAPATEAYGELYDTANVRTMRQTFQQLLRRPVMYLVDAPPGSEKTFSLKHLVAELNRSELTKNGTGRRAFYVYARIKMRPTQLLKQIAVACGVSSAGDGPRIARSLAFAFQSRRALLIIDEAQHLSPDCLEAVRSLVDEPPQFSILLSGSHNLRQMLTRCAATLGQVNNRIIEKVHLPGVSRQEAEAITELELGYYFSSLTPDVVKRKISGLIDRALTWDAYSDGFRPELVKRLPTPRDLGSGAYIDIRSLTNSIDRVKMQHPAAAASEVA